MRLEAAKLTVSKTPFRRVFGFELLSHGIAISGKNKFCSQDNVTVRFTLLVIISRFE